MSLTAAERETVLSISDDEKVWLVSSYRRSDITRLMRNPNFTVTEEGTHDGTAYVFGTLPLNAITIRTQGGKSKTGENRNPSANVQKCGEPKKDGSTCGMVAKKDTGKCRWHS